MIKYANKERTLVTNGRATGSIEYMISRGYMTEADIEHIIPWRTLEEWKSFLWDKTAFHRRISGSRGVDYLGHSFKTEAEDIYAINSFLMMARDQSPPFSHPSFWKVSTTTGIHLTTEEDYLELRRVIVDRAQEGLNAEMQSNLIIDALESIEEAENFDVDTIFHDILPPLD